MGIFTKVKTQEKANFAKNLAVMLESGITIDTALSTLTEQTTSKHLKQSIEHVLQEIESGRMLSSAFKKEEKVFGSIFLNLVKAGEESGTLKENLTFLAKWFERSADLQREVSGATLYPKLVFGASVLLGGGLSVFILPRLVPLFSQLEVELPLITKVLLEVSVFLQAKWFLCLLGIIVIFVCFTQLKRVYAFKRFLHTALISTPFLGPIFIQYELALITQLFSTLLRSGLPLSRTVQITKNATQNIRFKESIQAMQTHIDSGKTLSEIMGQYPELYSKMCIGIVAVGEKSGSLSKSFVYLSEYYTKEVKAKAKRLPTVIEPILLVLIALVVGLVALAIILPIYKVTGSINR